MWGRFLGQGDHEDWRFPSSTGLHPIYSALAHIAAPTQPQIRFDATVNDGFSKMSQSWCWGGSWWENECSMPSVLWYSNRGSIPRDLLSVGQGWKVCRGLSEPGWWHRSRRALLSCCKESHSRTGLWRQLSSSLSLWWQMLKIICAARSCHHLGVVLFTALLLKIKSSSGRGCNTPQERDIIFGLKFPMSPAKNVDGR